MLEVGTEKRVRVSRADREQCGQPLPAGPRPGLPRRCVPNGAGGKGARPQAERPSRPAIGRSEASWRPR